MNRFLGNSSFSSYFILLIVYFLCRLFFQQFAAMKVGFIYPTGVLVNLFHSTGEFFDGKWYFDFAHTTFVIDETCSGTTFFSLLVAYIAFRVKTCKISYVYLLLAIPVTLLANAVRVLSSIYAYNLSIMFNLHGMDAFVHVITGVTAFLCSFLCIAYLIETAGNKNVI